MVSQKTNHGIERAPSDLHEDDLTFIRNLWADTGQFLTPEVIANRLASDIKDLHQDDPEEIADFGCGPGALTRAVSEEFPNSDIIGYDIDDAALEVFEVRFRSNKIQSIFQDILLEPLDENSTPAIISNPPYLLSRRLGPEATKKFRDSGHFSVMSGKLNTFSLFIQAALRSLSPGGVAAFVVPIGVSNLDDHQPLRDLLVEKCDTIRITWCIDKIFFAEQGASVEVLLLTFRKRMGGSNGTDLEILEWDGREVLWRSGLFQSETSPVFPTRSLHEIEGQKGTPITEEFVIVARGFNWKKGWKSLKLEDADAWGEELHPVVKGGDIRPDGQLSSELIEINYIMLKERDLLSRTCDLTLHSSTRPRLLLADITSKIKVTYTTKPILPMNSVKVIFHKEDSENRLQNLMNFLREESTFRRLKLGRPNLHLTKGNLETLLIPQGDA